MRHSVVLSGGVGFCNAVRRSLLTEVTSWACCEVEFRENTSCQTDEYLAHRLGQLTFRRAGEGDTMTLRVEGRTAMASDVQGVAFEAVHPEIEVMHLAPGQAIDATLRFDRHAAKVHSRYASCAAVGMEQVDGDGRHRLTLELNDGRSAREALDEALDALDANLSDALRALAHQPATPPKSMC